MPLEILHCPSDRERSALQFPRSIDNVYLDGVSTSEWTVPLGVTYVVISPTTPVWVNLAGGISAVPSSTTPDDAALYLPGPVEFSVSYGDILSFWAGSAANVTIGKYVK